MKCVVVGDDGVGKVCTQIFSLLAFHPESSRPIASVLPPSRHVDLSPNFIHDEQIPYRICSNGESFPSASCSEDFFFQTVYTGV